MFEKLSSEGEVLSAHIAATNAALKSWSAALSRAPGSSPVNSLMPSRPTWK